MPGRYAGPRVAFAGKSWSWQLGQSLDEVLRRITDGMSNLQGVARLPLRLVLNQLGATGTGPAPALDDHTHELDLGLSAKGDLLSHTGAAYSVVGQGAAADGSVLKKDSGQPSGLAWGTGASSLDDLTDVTLTAPASGDRLRYDGSQWVNSTLAWVPLTTVVAGVPDFVWDADDNLVMTEAPL